VKLAIASTLVAVASLLGSTSPAIASADPGDTVTMTVDGVDYPVCAVEDCSDQAGQVGVWFSKSTGHWLLELGEFETYVVTN
jgi:plastocyanin